jgi:hypothetical protein
MHYIPMYLMFGEKKNENKEIPFIVYDAWKWTHETYTIETKKSLAEIAFAEVDPSLRMADADRKNNKLEIPKFK